MKIGVLKSRVEKLLSESYGKGTFKEEIKNFNRNVLSNKNISKLFFLYDELSTNKGYDQKLAEDFVFESITLNCIVLFNRITKLKFCMLGSFK